MELQRILVAMEYQRDCGQMLERARKLARPANMGADRQAEICLFVADYSDALERTYLFDKPALEYARKGFIGARRKWLEKQAETLTADGFQVVVNARWGKPRYAALLQEAERVGADLILKMTHPHSTLGRTFLAPGDWHLIREAALPLWLVKDRAWPERARIAACVDPVHEDERSSGRDKRLLARAQELTESLRGELHVIHAYEPMPTGLVVEFDALFAHSDTVREEARLRHQQAFDSLLQSQLSEPAQAAAQCHFEEGPPAQVIADVVRREAIDLVVMGAVARSGLERLLIGSTAEELLDALDSDLLILK